MLCCTGFASSTSRNGFQAKYLRRADSKHTYTCYDTDEWNVECKTPKMQLQMLLLPIKLICNSACHSRLFQARSSSLLSSPLLSSPSSLLEEELLLSSSPTACSCD